MCASLYVTNSTSSILNVHRSPVMCTKKETLNRHVRTTIIPRNCCYLSNMTLVGSDVLLLRNGVGRAVLAPGVLGGDALGLWVSLPEVLLAAGEPLHPRWEKAARDLVGPVLLLLLVMRHNTTARSLLDDPDKGVDDDVGAYTGNQAVGDGVGKGHDGECEEGGDSVAHIAPVDVLGGCGHERTNNDQRTAGSPRRDRGEDWGEENGDEEGEASEDGCKTSLATFRDASTGLDESGDWSHTHKRTDRDTQGVDSVGDGRVLEILGALIDGAAEASHGVQSTSAYLR
jgi:hypothetical protein